MVLMSPLRVSGSLGIKLRSSGLRVMGPKGLTVFGYSGTKESGYYGPRVFWPQGLNVFWYSVDKVLGYQEPTVFRH